MQRAFPSLIQPKVLRDFYFDLNWFFDWFAAFASELECRCLSGFGALRLWFPASGIHCIAGIHTWCFSYRFLFLGVTVWEWIIKWDIGWAEMILCEYGCNGESPMYVYRFYGDWMTRSGWNGVECEQWMMINRRWCRWWCDQGPVYSEWEWDHIEMNQKNLENNEPTFTMVGDEFELLTWWRPSDVRLQSVFMFLSRYLDGHSHAFSTRLNWTILQGQSSMDSNSEVQSVATS